VLAIRDTDDDAPPPHFRLRSCTGAPLDPTVVDRVHALVGDGNAVVVLGARTDRDTTTAQFEAYFKLVKPGSYVIVTDTIVNGNPVWTSFGPGPIEGIKQILNRHGKFVADPEMEKYALTFNPGGFLRREP
jgi:cephalosporin hydroxylase